MRWSELEDAICSPVVRVLVEDGGRGFGLAWRRLSDLLWLLCLWVMEEKWPELRSWETEAFSLALILDGGDGGRSLFLWLLCLLVMEDAFVPHYRLWLLRLLMVMEKRQWYMLRIGVTVLTVPHFSPVDRILDGGIGGRSLFLTLALAFADGDGDEAVV